jgi:MGT family glycosyltransferase
MFKIAFIVPPFLGHIFPTLGIGKELILRGHHVYWISMLATLEEMIPEGGKCIIVKSSSELYSDIDFGLQSLQGLYEKILIPLNLSMYYAVKPYIESENFDVIVTDHQAFAGAVLAHEFNIPYITSVTAPAAIEQSVHFPEVMNYEHDQIVKLQYLLGVDNAEPLVCASPLTLVYTTTAFLQNKSFPLTYKFVGPSIEGRISDETPLLEIDERNSSKPKVLVTLGSLLKRDLTFVDKVIEAFKNEDVTVILVADPALKTSWPSNFLVYHHVPQMSVLEKVQAVICHAGYNTVCEALSFGLPIITLPMVNDQSYIATKVKNSGAGIRLKYKRLKSNHLTESLRELLTNPAYARAAMNIKRSFEKAGGSWQAANLIERFCIQNKEYTQDSNYAIQNFHTINSNTH